MKQKLLLSALVSLILGFLFNVVLVDHEPGLSFFVYVSLVLIATFGLAKYFKTAITRSSLLLVPFILFFSSMFFVRANMFLSFLNFLNVSYLLMLMYLLLRDKRELWTLDSTDYIGRIVRFPLQVAGRFFELVREVGTELENRDEATKKQHKLALVPILRGVAISVPLLVIFILLFASADKVFSKYVSSIFSFNISGDLVARTIIIAIVTAIFIGLFGWLFFNRKQGAEENIGITGQLGAVESSIVLGSVGTLFLLFILIQIRYLFGGQNRVMSTDITYADYARQGFFALIVVSIISLLLIMIVNSVTLRRNQKQKQTMKVLSLGLIGEVLIIMLSAHMRLSLYEDAYGYTGLRLYSHLMIVWLAVVFAMLVVHIVRESPRQQLALQVFMSVIAFMLFVNLLNPDRFIAKQSIQRYRETGKLDMAHLGTLSTDATPELVKLLDDSNQDARDGMSFQLNIVRQLSERHDNSWQSKNLSNTQAKQSLQKHTDQLKVNDYKAPYDVKLYLNQ